MAVELEGGLNGFANFSAVGLTCHLAAIALGFRARRFDPLQEGSDAPVLPLRPGDADLRQFGASVPDDVLDATALRPLMDALIEHSRDATAEFDELFGERA